MSEDTPAYTTNRDHADESGNYAGSVTFRWTGPGDASNARLVPADYLAALESTACVPIPIGRKEGYKHDRRDARPATGPTAARFSRGRDCRPGYGRPCEAGLSLIHI